MAAGQPTSRLLAQALGNGARVLEVDVPAVGLAGGVLEGEGEDGVALLQGVLAVGLAGVESGVDRLEGLGGGELVCFAVSDRPSDQARRTSTGSFGPRLTVLERHSGGVW